MNKFHNKYRISSARHQHWNYGWDGTYFITICTKNKECSFGKITDKKMQLSHIGIVADILWYEIKNHTTGLELGIFQVMPNHLHGILHLKSGDKILASDVNAHVETRHALSLPLPEQTIGQQRFQNPGKGTISSIIGSYKSAVTKHAHRLGFDFVWQPRFHDHIIRDEASYQKISNYIANNVENWKEDKFYME